MMHPLDVGHREIAAPHAGLVRDHEELEPGILQPPQRRTGARNEGHVLHPVEVGPLLDEGSVTVQKHGAAHACGAFWGTAWKMETGKRNAHHWATLPGAEAAQAARGRSVSAAGGTPGLGSHGSPIPPLEDTASPEMERDRFAFSG